MTLDTINTLGSRVSLLKATPDPALLLGSDSAIRLRDSAPEIAWLMPGAYAALFGTVLVYKPVRKQLDKPSTRTAAAPSGGWDTLVGGLD